MSAKTNDSLLHFFSTALACFGGVSAALWAFGGSGSRSPANVEPPSVVDVAAQQSLIDAVEDLSRHVAVLDRPDGALSAPIRSEGARSPVDAATSARTDALLEEVVELLKTSRIAPGPVARVTEELDIPRNPSLKSKLNGFTADDNKQLTTDHLLWTRQKVLSAYGSPNAVGGDANLQYWFYNRLPDRSVRFNFNAGVVVDVKVE